MRLSSLFAFLAVAAAAQTTAPPAFEVASVKMNPDYRQEDPRTWRPILTANPANFTARNANLKVLVAFAWDVQRPQVIVPDWVEFQRYDIQAKIAAPSSDAETRLMLQALLVERFKLRVHRETREMEALALVVPKGGHKMKASMIVEGPIEHEQDPVLGAIVKGVPLGEFIREMSRETAVPVIDMTGLKGRFDFPFNPQKYVQAMRSMFMSGNERPATEAEAQSILMENIIAGELGLKLEKRKAAVEVVVIDAAEKTPVEN